MQNTRLFKDNTLSFLCIVSSILLYLYFAYALVRTDYITLITLYSLLFGLFYKYLEINKNNIKQLTIMAFVFRALFVFSIPNLSQDFYRFIWDGRMLLEGFNPYLYTPESFISKDEFPIAQAQELYVGMQSLNASHFTNYPPINQLCFFIAALISSKSILGAVIVLKLIIITADFGTLYFGKKLLEQLKIPVHNIFWYLLNPFIIIELSGNLHFEGVMIFFLIWSLYLLQLNKWKWSAVVLSASIATKLIPLLFLPLFFNWLLKASKSYSQHVVIKPSKLILNGLKKSVVFYGIVLLNLLVLFIPFYASEFIANYSKTIGLWFTNFEFNASIYYVLREIGYSFRGWNEIAIITKITTASVILYTLYRTFFKKNITINQLIISMLFVLSFHFFTTTTVHPWYVATLLILSVFTSYKFPLVWSFVITISYLAYANTSNTENLWIIGVEYVIVYAVLIWELRFKKNPELKHA